MMKMPAAHYKNAMENSTNTKYTIVLIIMTNTK